MRISDWSSDVCSSDLRGAVGVRLCWSSGPRYLSIWRQRFLRLRRCQSLRRARSNIAEARLGLGAADRVLVRRYGFPVKCHMGRLRSEEHTSELQSLMRISYAVFCLKKKITTTIRE